MFLEALRGSGLPSFRYKYRHVDLLLLDDVQFFLGKRATLVELQNTIDSLLREQRQLVLAADRSPAELSKFGPELTARLAGGSGVQHGGSRRGHASADFASIGGPHGGPCASRRSGTDGQEPGR